MTQILVFPKIGLGPQNGRFIMENPIKMHDLGLPLFSETSICWNEFGVPVGFPGRPKQKNVSAETSCPPGIVVTKYPHPHRGGDGGD